MIENITMAAKFKTVLSILSILLLGGSLYEISGHETQNVPGITASVETTDPFTKDIQTRAQHVENAAMEAVNQQGKMSPLEYKQTCESSMVTIRSERLDTEYNYNTLSDSQKELVQNYQAYLQEASTVVIKSYSGETVDLTKMNELKAKLN